MTRDSDFITWVGVRNRSVRHALAQVSRSPTRGRSPVLCGSHLGTFWDSPRIMDRPMCRACARILGGE